MAVIGSNTALFLLFSLPSFVLAYPNGAPPEACDDLVPRGPHGAAASTTFNPYSVTFRPEVEFVLSENMRGHFYTAGETYTVTLHSPGGNTFRGFLIQLRSEIENNIVANQLTANQNSTTIKPHACDPVTGGFTHTNRNIKNSIEFQWTPVSRSGFVFFRFTVVQSVSVHYDAFQSVVLVENREVCTNSTRLGPATISWTATRTHVTFSIRAPSMNGHYVALGFSNDRMMEGSDIVVGAVDGTNSFIDDRWASAQTMPLPDSQQDLSGASATLANGKIVMSFTRLLRTNDTTRDITLTSNQNSCVYFLLARGTSNVTARTINRHLMTDRFISMERVCLCGGAQVVTSLSLWVLLLVIAIQYLL